MYFYCTIDIGNVSALMNPPFSVQNWCQYVSLAKDGSRQCIPFELYSLTTGVNFFAPFNIFPHSYFYSNFIVMNFIISTSGVVHITV